MANSNVNISVEFMRLDFMTETETEFQDATDQNECSRLLHLDFIIRSSVLCKRNPWKPLYSTFGIKNMRSNDIFEK